ncbi:hypothetical protein BV20DRAFT_973024 [Pilatotrama ljubarskyi]|nr:hypothetical protein BV20DRAFT_973024 [Pilatotrama ljubarskyi]
MPRLYRITIREDCQEIIPWFLLNIILSTPTIRILELRGKILNDHDVSRASRNFQPSPIISLHYIPGYLRRYPRSCSIENDMLALLLQHLCQSLQTLGIPSECTPFPLLGRYEWPRLHELRIHGDAERVWTCPIPLVVALSHMPCLRVLSLKLVRRNGQHPQPIWPPDCDIPALPWPGLESLTLSWPCAEDRVLEHLPSTLRHLSLRCWPRLYTVRSNDRALSRAHISWNMGAPPWISVLRALQRCTNGRTIQSLDLEYSAVTDMDDAELLGYIPTAFSHLQELQLYRYCCPIGASAATVEEISAMVSGLDRLRVLRLYLDFEYRVLGPESGYRRAFGTSLDKEAMQGAADALLKHAGPSLECLCLLGGDYTWTIYRLAHNRDGGVEVHTEWQRTDEGDGPFE